MKRRFLAAAVLALAQAAGAQSVPAANYTDMWWNPAESGWGVSFTQHVATNQAYAVWYTYDPREPDNTTTLDAGDFKPLWIVMAGGQWLTPTQMRGEVFVTNGTPYFQSGSSTVVQSVGSFTFTFNDPGDFNPITAQQPQSPAQEQYRTRRHRGKPLIQADEITALSHQKAPATASRANKKIPKQIFTHAP